MYITYICSKLIDISTFDFQILVFMGGYLLVVSVERV